LLSFAQIEKLQAVLSDEEVFGFNFSSFKPIPLPLDPEVHIKGIIPESASLFKVSPRVICGCSFFCQESSAVQKLIKGVSMGYMSLHGNRSQSCGSSPAI